LIIPEVPPNWKLRKKLEKKSVGELYEILKNLIPGGLKQLREKIPED
jgi:hypothetical protein